MIGASLGTMRRTARWHGPRQSAWGVEDGISSGAGVGVSVRTILLWALGYGTTVVVHGFLSLYRATCS